MAAAAYLDAEGRRGNLNLRLRRNQLLGGLPDGDLQRLWPLLTRIPLRPRQVLHHADTPFQHLYFIEQGLTSVHAATDRRKDVEVWLVGHDGVVGSSLALGCAMTPFNHVVQVGGWALRMHAGGLQTAMVEIASFRRMMLRYLQLVLVQTSQSGACNASHPLLQRLARLLLTAQDCCGGDDLHLSHEILARMLGSRRAGITERINGLERQGIVGTARCLIRIRDRERLEALSCGCYGILRREYARFLHDIGVTDLARSQPVHPTMFR